ncbi:predicted protein [Uncinocarpus reesii 1704]|uniref:Uncharacterized protein n=1 Tax=Uncinocarpus reesii (strain UAMH 1704) TaxID=336963 RepID=C4JWV6_UNCRE|nr:uncharacterized protein UREG_06129 [Uncinocarpus reesii 1704]EEP81264.1 predicted protein [Uncinocarpus reesii 1704]
MAMQSTLITRRETSAQPVPELSGAFASNQSSYTNSPMTETLVGVEPWMQEMLHEDLFSTPSLGSTYETFAGFETDTVPSTFAMNDPALFGAESWSAHGADSCEFAQTGDVVFAPGTAFESFDSSTDFDADLASFLSGNQATQTSPQQSFDHLPEAFETSASHHDHSQIAFNQVTAAFRELTRARAAADPRPVSNKQKQRDASIALYLERLRDACEDAVAVINSSGSSNHSADSSCFSSPNLNSLQNSFHSNHDPVVRGESESIVFDKSMATDVNSQQLYPVESPSHSTASVSTPHSEASSTRQQCTQPPVTGGVELVMDLNMNAATTLPRRHRPRTQAQRERYLAVRNRGACEKHKKQHKRCTCVDKDIAPSESLKQNSVGLKLPGGSITKQSSGIRSQQTQSSSLPSGGSTTGYKWCPGDPNHSTPGSILTREIMPRGEYPISRRGSRRGPDHSMSEATLHRQATKFADASESRRCRPDSIHSLARVVRDPDARSSSLPMSICSDRPNRRPGSPSCSVMNTGRQMAVYRVPRLIARPLSTPANVPMGYHQWSPNQSALKIAEHTRSRPTFMITSNSDKLGGSESGHLNRLSVIHTRSSAVPRTAFDDDRRYLGDINHSAILQLHSTFARADVECHESGLEWLSYLMSRAYRLLSCTWRQTQKAYIKDPFRVWLVLWAVLLVSTLIFPSIF